MTNQCTQAIEVIKFPEGAEIIKEGDAGSGLYIIYEGEVSVIVSNLVPADDGTLSSAVDFNVGDDIGVDTARVPISSRRSTEVELKARIENIEGELVVSLPDPPDRAALTRRERKMSMLAEGRIKKANVNYTEDKRISMAGFFGERSLLTGETAIATVKVSIVFVYILDN